MRCPDCEAPIDVLDQCQDCIELRVKLAPKDDSMTHCKAGHEMTEDNIGWSRQGTKSERRYCLICRRVRVNANREQDRLRKRAKRLANAR